MPAPANLDPAFASVLAPFALERIDLLDEPVIGIWPNLHVAYFNPSAERRIRAHAPTLGAWGVGSSVFPAFPERLRFRYVDELQRVLAQGTPLRRVEPPMRAGEEGRQIELLPLWGAGLLLTSAWVIEPARGGAAALDPHYRADNGFVLECSYCHKFRRIGEVERWDWVPLFVERTPAQTTHGVCPVCFGFNTR